MKPTMEHFLDAVVTMQAIIPFFPKERRALALLSQLLAQFVGTKEELDWLVLKGCAGIRDWEKSGGIVELRGLFCTHFKPADGIFADSTTPGMQTEAAEARFLAREIEENEIRFQSYQAAALSAPEEDRQPFALPEVKRIPEPKKRIQ